MYEREENAQFSLISYSKERRFRVFQTLPDSWKNKKLLQVLTWFLKLVYYRDYLGKIWRNSKIHDCQPILENYRHWLLRRKSWSYFRMKFNRQVMSSLLQRRQKFLLMNQRWCGIHQGDERGVLLRIISTMTNEVKLTKILTIENWNMIEILGNIN